MYSSTKTSKLNTLRKPEDTRRTIEIDGCMVFDSGNDIDAQHFDTCNDGNTGNVYTGLDQQANATASLSFSVASNNVIITVGVN